MGFTRQVISAGAETTSQTLGLISILSELRQEQQEIQAEMATMEATASLAVGNAQKDALDKESDISMSRAEQQFIQGGFSIAQEGVGQIGETVMNRSEEAKTLTTDITNHTKWRDGINNVSKPDVIMGFSPNDLAAERSKAQNMSPEDVAAHLKNVDPSAGPPSSKDIAILEVGKNSPQFDELKKQTAKGLERAEKRQEYFTSRTQRRRDQFKTLMTAGSEIGQASQNVLISQTQQEEAVIKLVESQANFLKDSLARTDRSISDGNSGLGQSISGVIAASNKEWESNVRG